MEKNKSGQSFYQMHHAEMEGKILRVSKRLLLKRGFASLSMDEIADSVGLSRQRLYCYFRGLDPIIYEIQIADMANFITAMKDAYRHLFTTDPEKRLQELIEAAFAYQNARKEDFLFTSDFDTYYRAKKKGISPYQERYEQAYNDHEFMEMLHQLFLAGKSADEFRQDLDVDSATIFWANTLQLLLERISIFETNSEQHNPAEAQLLRQEMTSALKRYLH